MLLNKLFYTPVWSGVLDELSDETIKLSSDFCLDQSEKEYSAKFSNIGGFQSFSQSYDYYTDTPLLPILDLILLKLNECMNKDLSSSRSLKYNSIWFNVNKKNNYNNEHSHGGILSGAFYIKVPKNNSLIYFSRQNQMDNWFYGNLNSNHNTETTTTEIQFQPCEKMLIIFPAWLSHGVKPSNTDDERISISFNTQLI